MIFAVLGIIAIAVFLVLFAWGAVEAGGWVGALLVVGVAGLMLYGAVTASAAIPPRAHTRGMAKTLVDHLMVPAPPNVKFVRSVDPSGQQDLLSTAATDPATGTIYYSQHLDPFSRAHEVGHLFDAQELTGADRLRAEQIMGFGKGRWDQGTGTHGYTSPDEWFADYYAASANHLDLKHQGVSSYAQFTPKRLSLFETWISGLGRDRGLQPYQQ